MTGYSLCAYLNSWGICCDEVSTAWLACKEPVKNVMTFVFSSFYILQYLVMSL